MADGKIDGKFVIRDGGITQGIAGELGLTKTECKKIGSIWNQIIEKFEDEKNMSVTNNKGDIPNSSNNYVVHDKAKVIFSKDCWKEIVDLINKALGKSIKIDNADDTDEQDVTEPIELTPVKPHDETPKEEVKPPKNDPPVEEPKEPEQPEETRGKHVRAENTYNPQDKADGYIDPSVQQGSGDCWLLSGLNALTETQWGRDAIKQAINVKPNGDILITFKGAYGKKKQFLITKSELDAAKNNSKYSRGDMDVLAIELAVEKYRRQFGETLDGGQEEEIFRLITGSHNTQTIESKGGIKNIIQKAKANPGKYIISANFYLGKEAGRDEYHAYNVSRFETDEYGQNWVILTNPWDSRREIRITEEEFMKYVVEIQILANPKGNTKTASVNSDGKIGNTKGAKKGTDGNVAAAIHAVANMNPNIIKDSISHDSSGNIRVTLKGVGETFIVTPQEIAKAKDSGKYTEDDDDVIALEIAMEKYGKKRYQNQGLAETPMFAGFVQAGTDIYGISDTTAIFLLTGQENKYAVLDKDGKYQISAHQQISIPIGDLADLINKPKT